VSEGVKSQLAAAISSKANEGMCVFTHPAVAFSVLLPGFKAMCEKSPSSVCVCSLLSVLEPTEEMRE
jgi:hypothetical protein